MQFDVANELPLTLQQTLVFLARHTRADTLT
jgi:hypothetical protein